MSRKKGQPKTGGRQAGTPNKFTGTLKEFVVNLVDENREQINKDLKKLTPKDRLNILERLMQYVLPKQQSVKADVDYNELCKDIKIRYIGNNGEEVHFASSEDEVDLKRDNRWNKDRE